MAELPILPVRVQSLLGDTGHMTAEEFGAYCRLLFTMWLHGGSLRNDAGELSRIAGATPQRWAKIAPCVMSPMTVTTELVSQKRLSETWNRIHQIQKKRAMAGLTRWKRKNH